MSSHENLNNERKHEEFENWIYVYFRFGMNDFDSLEGTPWTVNGWNLQNDPFTIENDLPNLHEDMFQPLIFRGVPDIDFAVDIDDT